MIENLSGEFVDKYYEMDPQTEDLLPDATFLRDGMVVLIGTSGSRLGLKDLRTEGDKEMHRIRNRWARIQHISFRPMVVGQRIEFIATYAGGIKKQVSYDASTAWLVKLDSMPPSVVFVPAPISRLRSIINTLRPWRY